MKFSEIANRLTGISTPLVGVSWQPTDLEVSGRVADRLSEGAHLGAASLVVFKGAVFCLWI